jgi:hypothetical protein
MRRRLLTNYILHEVEKERLLQDAKWGEQHHPNGTSERFEIHAIMAKQDNESSAPTTWWGILKEEMFEAAAETDEVKLREELIQVAAVAVAWIEDIDKGCLNDAA